MLCHLKCFCRSSIANTPGTCNACSRAIASVTMAKRRPIKSYYSPYQKPTLNLIESNKQPSMNKHHTDTPLSPIQPITIPPKPPHPSSPHLRAFPISPTNSPKSSLIISTKTPVLISNTNPITTVLAQQSRVPQPTL